MKTARVLWRDQLASSHHILVNDPGVASAMAWMLRRNDMLLYQYPGELRYGLRYADARGRFIPKAAFDSWLKQHRQRGTVSLILERPAREENVTLRRPKPDFSYQQDRLLLLQYKPLP